MAEIIKDKIIKAFDSGKTLVFTSELVAENWLANYLSGNENRAIFRERAISWDSFKLTLVDTKEKKPADNISRNVFASQLLEDENVFEKLVYFSNKEKPESKKSYASAIAGFLPSFAYFEDSFVNTIGNEEDKIDLLKIANDIHIIRPRYEQFLEENNLYEYNYLYMALPDKSLPNKNYFFVFPETYNDPIITSALFDGLLPEDKEEVLLNYSSESKLPLVEYENSITEVRDVFRQIRDILRDETNHSYDIAITCANIESYRPFLEDEAKKYDLELHFTTSKQLTHTIAGKFFFALDKIKKEEFSFASINNLLLNPIFKFKADCKLRNRRIIDYAIDTKFVDGTIEQWKEHFDKAATRKKFKSEDLKFPSALEDKEYFVELVEDITKIIDENDAEIIYNNVLSFIDKYIENRLDENLGKCLGLLKDLQLYPNNNDVWELFLATMGQTTYIDKINNGIKVYSYPVSVGLSVPYHFVIGLCDDKTIVSFDKYPYWVSKKDKYYKPELGTDITMSIYCSDELCKSTKLSGTSEAFDGAHLLPIFLLNNVVQTFGDDRNVDETKQVEDRLNKDLYVDEKAFFRGESQLKEITKNQQDSFANANTILCETKIEFPEPKDLQGLKISASYFKCYVKCPYWGFVSIYYRPESVDFAPARWDVRVIGDILHESLQNSLDELKENNQGFYKLTKELLLKNLNKAAEEKLENFELCSTTEKNAIFGRYKNVIPAFADFSNPKIKDFISPNAELLENEIEYKGDKSNYVKINDIDAAVGGRPDTVLKYTENSETKYILLDYKTSGKDDYVASDLTQCSPQVAIYARVIEENENGPVTHGAYYSFNDKEMKILWPPTGKQGFDYDAVKNELEKNFNEFAQSVKNGNFPKNGNSKTCGKCYYKQICRKEFIAK